MKSKNFILAVFIVAIMGIGLWWFIRSVIAPEKTAAAPMSANVSASKPAVPPPQIAKSLVPPVQTKSAAAKATDAATEPPDPQADLKTALPDIARLLRNGDWLIWAQTYMRPDKLTPEVMQQFLDAKQKRADQPCRFSP